MRARVARLEALWRLARDRERRAARALAAARRAAEQARGRLAELEGYLEEYRAEGPGATVTAGLLAGRSRFLASLQQALTLQAREVASREAEVQARRRDWETARRDARRLEKALERGRSALAREAARRERRLEDEVAARWHGRR